MQDAETKLIEENLRLVYKIAGVYARNEDEFEEFVQEGTVGLAKAVRGRNKARSFGKFASTCVSNSIRDSIKRRMSHKKTVATLQADNLTRHGINVSPPRQECAAITKQFLSIVPDLEKDRASALFDKFVLGKSYREIADDLGCPEGTVMSRIHYDRKRIREALECQ